MRFATALLALMLPLQASATNGLEWRWAEGDKRTWELSAHVLMPQVIVLESERNHQARLLEWYLEIVTTCEVVDERKRGWNLHCDVHDVRLRGLGIVQDHDKLPALLAEFDERISAGWVQLFLSRNGRISDFDLEGVEKETPRLKRGHEVARIMLYRAFTSLDLQLPRKGDDRGEGAWADDRPRALEMVPAFSGTQGGVECAHVVKKVDGGEVHMASAGRGAITAANSTLGFFTVELNGAATFDRERGLMLDRGYNMRGEPTASSGMATTNAQYLHGAVAQYLPDGPDSHETYGASGLLRDDDSWGPALR